MTRVLDVGGISDFNVLHALTCDEEVQLYAVDCVALGGEDLRAMPLSSAKPTSLGLARRPGGIFVVSLRGWRDRSRPVSQGL